MKDKPVKKAAPKKPIKKGKYYTEIKVKQSPDELLNTLLNSTQGVKKKRFFLIILQKIFTLLQKEMLHQKFTSSVTRKIPQQLLPQIRWGNFLSQALLAPQFHLMKLSS